MEPWKSPKTVIQERLDRFLALPQWVDIFPVSNVRHFPIYKSDHATIMLNTETRRMEDYRDRLFRFESFWLSNEKYHDIVRNSWKEGICSPIETRVETCANSPKGVG